MCSRESAAALGDEAGVLAVSVVSHGHKRLVQALLDDMARHGNSTVTRVVLTLNLPEDLPRAPLNGWPFVLQVIRNASPKGFGANHNYALRDAAEPFVCVLNPDVRWMGGDPLRALVQSAAVAGVGCSYPAQVDSMGRLQDSERELPTPMTLLRRRVFKRREVRVDWVNGACLVLPTPAWVAVGGFDEAYFMYCEDVDLCLRLRLAGWALMCAPVQVVHVGQRTSNRHWIHLVWHVKSLLRFWSSPVYRQARQMLRL